MTALARLLPTSALPATLGRYLLRERFDSRAGVERWTAADDEGRPVVLVVAERLDDGAWPSLIWEQTIREKPGERGLSGAIEQFEDAGRSCLALEYPDGYSLWDVWDDTAFGAAERFGWLGRLAQTIRGLHAAGAALESLRPEQVRISRLGEVMLDPTVILLPLPAARDLPVRPTLVSPPELHDGLLPDPRSDLYCFGTVLYALELGHELSELDFRALGDPLPFLDRFPDAHPALGRLLGRTAVRFREQRFPSAKSGDLSGFDELASALGEAQRVLGRVRHDVAAWTSSGMVRGGNEDALAVIRGTELREGVQDEYALVLLADGMGGSAAGEVAAALTVQTLRRQLLDNPAGEPGTRPAACRRAVRRRLADALSAANRVVFDAGRENSACGGMGSTAEAVYLDGRQLVVGHVGDSRTYHLHHGTLRQLTRDHTMVGRMVELGRLTPEQAATHPRRNELRQAIGGRPDVRPEVVRTALSPGDWVVVCSDGLTGALRPTDIQEILEQSASAEAAARRLVNRANQRRAADNVSVVVVRAT
jgi:protein phosphatase